MKGDLKLTLETELGIFSMETVDWMNASLIIHDKALPHYIENPALFAYKDNSNWVEIKFNDEVIGVLSWLKQSKEAITLESIEIVPEMIGKGLLRKIYTGLETICEDVGAKSIVVVQYTDICEKKLVHLGFKHYLGCLVKKV